MSSSAKASHVFGTALLAVESQEALTRRKPLEDNDLIIRKAGWAVVRLILTLERKHPRIAHLTGLVSFSFLRPALLIGYLALKVSILRLKANRFSMKLRKLRLNTDRE